MKKMPFCYIFVIFLLFSISPAIFSQTNNFSISNINVTLALSNPLLVKFHNLTKTSSSAGAVGREKKWILINLEYVAALKKATNLMRFNELIINFKVAIPNQTGINILTTAVTYPFVNFDGQKKYEVVFIPPKILSAILPDAIKVEKSLLKNIIVKVSFVMNNETIGVGYSPNADISAGNPFDKLEKMPTVKIIPNSIYDRTKTPWVNADFDKYELIKS